MTRRQRGCLWAALGGVAVIIIVLVALVAGAGWFVYQSSSIRQTKPTAEQARADIEHVRAQFAGRQPVVTLRASGEAVVAKRDGHGVKPETIHMLVWHPDDHELTKLTVPFWLLRFGGQKARFRIGDEKTFEELTELNLTAADIEAAGPGPLLDHTEDNGKVTLIWTE